MYIGFYGQLTKKEKKDLKDPLTTRPSLIIPHVSPSDSSQKFPTKSPRTSLPSSHTSLPHFIPLTFVLTPTPPFILIFIFLMSPSSSTNISPSLTLHRSPSPPSNYHQNPHTSLTQTNFSSSILHLHPKPSPLPP